MTARQPRRERRRSTAASNLPRPTADGSARRAPSSSRQREHHVTTDYSYVRKDLVLIAGVTAVTMAFVAAMWALL
jgi:hypothetical protein